MECMEPVWRILKYTPVSTYMIRKDTFGCVPDTSRLSTYARLAPTGTRQVGTDDANYAFAHTGSVKTEAVTPFASFM
jgi:hypothetical protein